MPLLSIGLPVYNGARLLEECLDSILGQSFRDFELIISDNASTDETGEICRRYAERDGRVRYFRQPQNLGAAKNYDFTFYQATGTYFKWHAHDDLLGPGYLEKTITVLEERPELAGATCQTKLIDQHSRPLVWDPERQRYVDPDGFAYGFDDQRWHLAETPVERFRGIVRHNYWNFEIFGIYRREYMANSGLHLPFYGSDKVFIAEMSLYGKLVFVPEPLFERRCHPDASERLGERQQTRWIDPNRRFLPFYRQFQAVAAYERALRRAPLSFGERWACRATVAQLVFRLHKWKQIYQGILSRPAPA